jgi:hypothetical protein
MFRRPTFCGLPAVGLCRWVLPSPPAPLRASSLRSHHGRYSGFDRNTVGAQSQPGGAQSPPGGRDAAWKLKLTFERLDGRAIQRYAWCLCCVHSNLSASKEGRVAPLYSSLTSVRIPDLLRQILDRIVSDDTIVNRFRRSTASAGMRSSWSRTISNEVSTKAAPGHVCLRQHTGRTV